MGEKMHEENGKIIFNKVPIFTDFDLIAFAAFYKGSRKEIDEAYLEWVNRPPSGGLRGSSNASRAIKVLRDLIVYTDRFERDSGTPGECFTAGIYFCLTDAKKIIENEDAPQKTAEAV
jgi:hypothetical protein